jgi:hypothetical protein
MMPSALLLIAAIVLTVASGLIEGRIIQRWEVDSVPPRAVERLDGFPAVIGPWILRSDSPLSDSAVRMLRCQGHFHRNYEHETTGKLVSVALMLGPAGPLVTHRPEVCYQSNNYSIHRPRRTVELRDEADRIQEFSLADFLVNDASGRRLLVYYGWTDGLGWVSPENPRFSLAGHRMLYKVQVASFESVSHAGGVDSARKFLQDALPHLIQVCQDSR